jgi:hypothetical protein
MPHNVKVLSDRQFQYKTLSSQLNETDEETCSARACPFVILIELLLQKYGVAATDAIQDEDPSKDFSEAQIARGVTAKAAKKNLTRKFAAASLAIMKTGKPYQEKRLIKIDQNTI